MQTDIPPADKHLDTRGLVCPEPVMLLHKTVRETEVGQTIEVCASDPSTQRDIPKFCGFLGHELLAVDERNGEFWYWIRKGAPG